MLFKKTKLKGFNVKELPPRSREKIDKDYSDNAFQMGHKSRIVDQLNEEIGHHRRRLTEIAIEGAKLPPLPVPSVQKPENSEDKNEIVKCDL